MSKPMTIEQARREGLLPVAPSKVPHRYSAANLNRREKLELSFLAAWKQVAKGLPMPEQQVYFALSIKRKWRFDFCWKSQMLAVEINGGQWTGGRHTTGSGAAGDWEKLNSAQTMGWVVLQYGTGRMKNPYRVAAEVADILRNRIATTPQQFQGGQ